MERQLLTLKTENSSGVMRRVTGVLSRKGHNMYSLHCDPTENSEVSEMKIVIECTTAEAETMLKQLNRLYDVFEATLTEA